MDQIKTTEDHNYQQLARQDLLLSMVVTFDTTHLLMSALNKEASWKAVVFGRRKKKGKMWNGQNKATKDHNYQQFARKDVLPPMSVTLDTTQLLISALNALALKKAIVFFWEEEEEK